jgi:hypothetical protein
MELGYQLDAFDRGMAVAFAFSHSKGIALGK